ncbi:MAG: universal stress protein [Polyangiales bacterium]
MAPFDRIVVPIDFSECSEVALDRAIALRDQVGGRIELLHVWASPEFVPVDSSLTVSTPGGEKINLTEYIRRQAEKTMHELIVRLEGRGVVGLSTRLVMGDAADVIVEASKNCDLIVMGTHGRSAIAHLFLGSVAERVVRRAECAVLTVRVPKEAPR